MKTRLILKYTLMGFTKNKLRTFLTLLGIIIGVSSLIAMLAIANGTRKAIIERIKSFGNNTITVYSRDRERRGTRKGLGSEDTLKPADAKAIQSNCAHVRSATPYYDLDRRVIYKNRSLTANIIGGTEDLLYIDAKNLGKGSFFTKEEVDSGEKVCVLSDGVANELFYSGQEPIDSTIRVNKIPFRVIGILKRNGKSGDDIDNTVMIPYTTLRQRVLPGIYTRRIKVSAHSLKDMPEAVDEIKTVLRQQHGLKEEDKNDFEIRSQDEALKLADSDTKTLGWLLGTLASISLLVGGIGIMNIMMVTVTERTKEIGIRMAVGAKRFDILKQFVIEAATIAFIGGILGIVFGYGMAKIISGLIKSEMYITLNSIILAVSSSSVIGVFFGLYPAWRASKMKPVQALRYE